MFQKFLDLESTERFWEIVKDELDVKLQKKEKIKFHNSIKRVLAEDIQANENLPAFNRSTVDGYAVKSQDIQGVSQSLPAYLELVGNVKMGEKTDIEIDDGQAAYIPTGGMMPKGADCVVMVEQTENISDDMVEIYKTAGVGENIIKKGEEIKKGEVILKRGHRIKPRDMGVFAGLGITEFEVYKKPRVAIISTGDELISPEKEMKFGEIRDINTYTITQLLSEVGAEVTQAGIVEDTFEKIKAAIQKYLDFDLILVSGGSSAGLKDVTVDIINKLGNPGVLVHGLKVKPGKPTILGKIDNTPIMGLPGHPGSAWMITNKFVLPLVKLLSGEYKADNILKSIIENQITQSAVLNRNLSSDKGREEMVPVKLLKDKGKITAEPLLGKSSFMRVFIESDGYLVIEAAQEGIEKGQVIDIYLFH